MNNLNGQNFVASIVGPAELPSTAVCFTFQNQDLLVHDGQSTVTVPTIVELDETQLRPSRLHFLGYWQSENGPIACYTGDLVGKVALPAKTALLGLRQLFGRFRRGPVSNCGPSNPDRRVGSYSPVLQSLWHTDSGSTD